MAHFASVLELPAGNEGARLVAWLVGEGESVRRGDPVAEVEWGTGRSEIALDGSGTLLRRLAVPGDWLSADLAVAIVGNEGDDLAPLLAEAGVSSESVDQLDPAQEQAPPGTALAVLPPRRLARAMGSAGHVDKPLSPEGERAAARAASFRLETPYVYAHADADATDLAAYCDRLNRVLGRRGRLRPADLVIKAAAAAMRRVPSVNATFLGEAIRFYTHIRIGLALPHGDQLVVPGIRDVDLKPLGALGEEVRELEDRVRSGELGAQELERAPLAICDLGEFGIDRAELLPGAAETAMLTLGRLRREPVIRGESVTAGYRMALALGCDERAAGDSIAARFLGEVAAIVEHPESLAL